MALRLKNDAAGDGWGMRYCNPYSSSHAQFPALFSAHSGGYLVSCLAISLRFAGDQIRPAPLGRS
jgi:hypothetical protein